MSLDAAHRGYEYQDLVAAIRLVDIMIESIVDIRIDEKLVSGDRFDDLTIIYKNGQRERIQIKHTEDIDRPLSLGTFTSDARKLRLDRLITAALADRDGPGSSFSETTFRILLRDSKPTDKQLLEILHSANPDPGPFIKGTNTIRLRFSSDVLWQHLQQPKETQKIDEDFLGSVREGMSPVTRCDLNWICNRLIIEVNSPIASLNIANPGFAENLLLERVRNEIGAGMYPNSDRSARDVAEALIRTARAARQKVLNVNTSELLRQTRLRTDFGAVSRAHPVDKAIEVSRFSTVTRLIRQAEVASNEGKALLLLGPPGQGKSWICQQAVETFSEKNWLVAEHYCYLGDADGEKLPRVLAESVFGSLLKRIAEQDVDLLTEKRPRFAVEEQDLIRIIESAISNKPERRVVLIVDGLDHVTRVVPGGSEFDPSFTLAEALAALNFPVGSVLIVLSQPGSHLNPFEDAGSITMEIPSLTEDEILQLATHLGITSSDSSVDPESSSRTPILTDRAEQNNFLRAISERSEGNALYVTYLCREALRNPTTMADPSSTVRNLPEFDGKLLRYYEHVYTSLGDQGAWVADVIALLDFPVSRNELMEIRPDMSHRVGHALDVLRPVLVERVTQGGIRIYHESFARFLRQPFENNECSYISLLDHIIKWMESKEEFSDSRVFRNLITLLAAANYHEKVVEFIDRDFLVNSISAGFPASAIISNLARSVASAARIDDWPAIVRFVELSRAAETYQDERFVSSIVHFVDVVGSLLGFDTLSERLLHDGRPVMSARDGLQLCAELDASGSVPPWREYMAAYIKESESDNTVYGEESDTAVRLAWLRGRLRLSSLRQEKKFTQTVNMEVASNEDKDCKIDDQKNESIDSQVKFDRLASWLDNYALPAKEVVSAIFDTHGFPATVNLINKLSHQGEYFLALAELINDGKIPDSEGNAHTWAVRSVKSGPPPGCTHRLIKIGMNVSELNIETKDKARESLLSLTRDVQERPKLGEIQRHEEWMDACAIAARQDPVGLSAAEALLNGPGWYTCWLRFIVALTIAEASQTDKKSYLSLTAIEILAEVDNPFLGDPRACDLYPIHGLIYQSVMRAITLMDNHTWEKAIEILEQVSASICTTLFGEQGGPLSRESMLHLAVNTSNYTRKDAVRKLINHEIKCGGGSKFYSDLAEYRLIAARHELMVGDETEARRYWVDACRLLSAYGWHKDVTIFEILDPLHSLISIDRARARVCVSKVQPLCERIPKHTDKKETRHAWRQWWQLLAEADPCALPQLILPRLMSSCNEPNWLLHGARSDLWRLWYGNCDPVVSGILRLTLEEPLEPNDVSFLRRLVEVNHGAESDLYSRLMIALLARVDERPYKYSYSNEKEFLDRDSEQVDEINAIASRAGIGQIAPLLTLTSENDQPVISEKEFPRSFRNANLAHFDILPFPPGMVGAVRAVRAWQSRKYDDLPPGWSTDLFANVLGYRIIELIDCGRETDAAAVIRLIADASRLYEAELVYAIAEGLERYGQSTLAAMSYALAWTRTRGKGGWMTFGGETNIASLQRGAQIDRSIVEKTVAEEIERVISQGLGTYGISQALMFGFAMGGIGSSCSVAFDIWDEAFTIISGRAPRVSKSDDPDDVYIAPATPGTQISSEELDAAFAATAVAGLAHASREQKRRALVAIQMLISGRASVVAPALGTALSSLSDPATLSWLLRVIELENKKEIDVSSPCQNALVELAGRPHLTVRALARRLLNSSEVPPVPMTHPDPDLLEQNVTNIVTPEYIDTENGNHASLRQIIDEVAGDRLMHAESIIPGLRSAIIKRVDKARKDETYKDLLNSQRRAYADSSGESWPDAFLVPDQVIEDAMQQSAAGARVARAMNGEISLDPEKFEDDLAKALLDDPEISIAVECTRQPRPCVTPPPARGDQLWKALRTRANDASAEIGINLEATVDNNGTLCGTIEVSNFESVPTIIAGRYEGWRLAATAESRMLPQTEWNSKDNDIAKRFRSIELWTGEDRQVLTEPPFSKGILSDWQYSADVSFSRSGMPRIMPIFGVDYSLRTLCNKYHGIGVQRPLLAPIQWFTNILRLVPHSYFSLSDDIGEAIALVTWRTEYKTSEYHLAWPRLTGAGIVIRDDLLARLNEQFRGGLIFRDFLVGPDNLCGDIED